MLNRRRQTVRSREWHPRQLRFFPNRRAGRWTDSALPPRESSSTISLRSQAMPYTVNNNGNNDHSTVHSLSGTTAFSNLSVPSKRRFPYWAATTILYTHHRYPPSSSQQHNLSRVLSASGSSQPSIRQPSFFFFTWYGPLPSSFFGYAERYCGLWGTLGTQGTLAAPRRMSPYPSPYASSRVRYTNLELDSDLSLWEW